MNQSTTISDKGIAESFGKKASEYHKKAEVQPKVARGLIASLKPWKGIIPDGPVLEVGAGSGILSELIIPEFPDKEIMITDISGKMIGFCQQRLENESLNLENVSFGALNVNEDDIDGTYSLIVSNFAAQWFQDTSMGLEKLADSLKPGGLLLCTFPGEKSFPEWYETCLSLGIPFTANALPNVEKVGIQLSMGPLQIDFYEDEITQEFSSAMKFFRHLKDLGASLSVNDKSLSYKQLKLIDKNWPKYQGMVKVTWHTVYLAAKKDL